MVRAMSWTPILEGSTGEPMDQSTRDAIKKARQANPLRLPDYRKVLEERDTLREEILCDYIASLLTLNRFLEAKLDLPTVLVSILHAFHNLSSLTIVRDHANDLATSPGPSDLPGLTVRKSVWRILALHSIAGGDQEVHKRFVEITNLHARTVGDQIIFILPFEFGRVLEKLEPLDIDEEGRHEVVESIRDFTTAQVALTDPRT